jgi:iron complex transport system substrate-binding protein
MIGLILAIVLVFGAFPCDAAGAASSPAPKRVISLAPSVTETVFALGFGHTLVGVTAHCDYPAAAQAIPKIGTFMSPSVEAILALRPELVIGVKGATEPAKARELERLGMRVVLLSLSAVGEILDAFKRVAALLGNPAPGEMLAGKVAAQFARVRERVSGAPTRPTLFLVGLRPLVAVGGRNYIDELITFAGGKNIAGGAAQPWLNLPDEFVVAKAPQVIIEAGMGSERETPGKHWADLKSIPAVKAGRVSAYPSDKILRPGPRIGDALEEVARLIHPECFSARAIARHETHGCESPRS